MLEKIKRFISEKIALTAGQKGVLYKKTYSEMSRKEIIYTIIFESDTWAGKVFDVALLIFITVSILIIFLESMNFFSPGFGTFLRVLEWIITLFFTAEYILRIYSAPEPRKYIFSFYGVIDLISTLPSYLSIFIGGAQYMLILRAFRLIRVFRIFRMFSFLAEGNMLLHALKESSRKIAVFFLFVLIITITLGTVMYMIESPYNAESFNNIPNSIYWTIVTLTTVGYGDITPVTGFGKFLSAFVMLLGYTIIAVPTGIVSASIMGGTKKECPHCGKKIDRNAMYCKFCGQKTAKETNVLE